MEEPEANDLGANDCVGVPSVADDKSESVLESTRSASAIVVGIARTTTNDSIVATLSKDDFIFANCSIE